MKPTRERSRSRSAATAPTRMPIDRSLERGWGREIHKSINQETCKKGAKGGIAVNNHSIRK
jgi:hypothetical protein